MTIVFSQCPVLVTSLSGAVFGAYIYIGRVAVTYASQNESGKPCFGDVPGQSVQLTARLDAHAIIMR